MSTGTVCSRVVATAGPDETVRAAAQRMAKNHVGSLVVTLPKGSPALYGMVTDRDIAVCCVAGNLDPDRTLIREVMTSPVHSIDEFTPLEEAVSRMATSGVRRLVVTDAKDELVGILSLDDVLDHLIKEAGSVGRLLEKQQAHVCG
jgi:CBS domain-containing protein